jgi:hypothetical protein
VCACPSISVRSQNLRPPRLLISAAYPSKIRDLATCGLYGTMALICLRKKHALERIAAIEKHLGLDKKIAA